MAFQVSPGVNVSEIDATAGIPATSVSTGAFVGVFNWGPADQIVSISTETQLASIFGKPDNNTAVSFLSAANFLAYSSDLKIVRAINSNVAGGTEGTSTAAAYIDSGIYETTGNLCIKNSEQYFNDYLSTGADSAVATFAARYPGALGNSLKVDVCPSNTAFMNWSGNTIIDSAPGTSAYAASKGANTDEMHIIVYDEDGRFTGTPGTVLETFPFVSKALDAKTDDGSSNYYEEVIYRTSKYIYVLGHPTSNANNWGLSTSSNTQGVIYGANTVATSFSLRGGRDGIPSSGNVSNSYSLFSNPDSVDISLIFTGGHDNNVKTTVRDLAESRKDCVAFISPSLSNVISSSASAASIVSDVTTNKSTYVVVDSGWKYQYDKYNDKYRWIPLNADIAGLCAKTDETRDPWFSPAGSQRGAIKNIVKLGFNPSKTDRDTLYKAGINPVVTFPGEGTILFGDKTFSAKVSAFDRINVRRLFIVLEKSISAAARASLFEFNDEFTRAQFVNLVEPFLRTVKGRRGIYDFRVVCDTTNNTADIIDANQFVGDIYIKPARSINYIQLNFVAVRTGVAFNEVVGQF
jgi:hypothetical protein